MSSHTIIESVEYRGHTIEIHYDEGGSAFANPRDWSNLGSIICWHRKYNLSDKDRPDDGPSGEPDRGHFAYLPEDFRKWAKEHRAIMLNIYMYEHSGIALSTSPFSCPWDSGQIGFIYVLPSKVREEFKVKSINGALKKKVLKQLEDEVKIYGSYVSGEVFDYVIKNTEDEVVGSCGGFVGHDEIKFMIESAREEIDSLIEDFEKRMKSAAICDYCEKPIVDCVAGYTYHCEDHEEEAVREAFVCECPGEQACRSSEYGEGCESRRSEKKSSS